MTAIEKYKEEKEDAKMVRKNRILSSAFELFSSRGIDTIAITDIAKKAEIGVASVYRYYETKEQIAVNTAVWAWKTQAEAVMESFTLPEYKSKTGFEKLSIICNMYLELFKNNFLFLRFIYFFDSYIFRQNIDKDNFSEYEQNITGTKELILEAINTGINDKTVKCPEGFSTEELYFTMMHSLFSTVQKLSLSENLLEMNKDVSGLRQIELLIKMLLDSIKA